MKQLLIFSLLFSSLCNAQTEQAWLFLSSKGDVQTLLNTPEDFLSERALERKEKHNIAIDERDLPINESYINQIKNIENITFHTASKWFNAIYVEGSQDEVNNLLNLDFVDNIFFMNRNLNSGGETTRAAKKISENKFEEVVIDEYGFTSNQIEQLNLQTFHNLEYTGEGILIGIMDSGFINVDTISAFDRAWQNNQIIFGYDAELDTELSFDESQGSHGTSVLSTMLGYIENEFVGTAIDAQYALFKTEVVASETPKEEAFWIAAAEKADSLGVDILNTSLGYSTFQDSKYNYSINDADGQTAFISQAAEIALEKGMLPVVSAGNSGSNDWGIITAPADSESVLSIGAIDINGSRAAFSSTGPTADGRIKPDVVALGLNATVIDAFGNISTSSGTSFSGPIMAGAVACLWQAFPEKNASEIMQMIRESGHLSDNPNIDLGYGIPDFNELALLIPETEGAFSESGRLLLKYNIINDQLEFLFSATESVYEYSIFNSLGQLVKSGNLNQFSSIQVNQLSTGLYIFKEANSEAEIFVKN